MRVAVHSSGIKSWGLWERTFSAKSLNVRPQTDNWKEPHQQNHLLISPVLPLCVFVLFHHFEKHTCRYTYRMKLPASKEKTAATLEVLQRCTNRQFWNRSQPILSGAYFLFLFFLLAQSDQGEAKITSVIHISDLSSYVAGTTTSINGGKPELYTVTNPQSLKSI